MKSAENPAGQIWYLLKQNQVSDFWRIVEKKIYTDNILFLMYLIVELSMLTLLEAILIIKTRL